MTISAQTRLAAVIGWPVRHSMSPELHNAAFAELGFDAVYVALPVPEGAAAQAVQAMRAFDWLGFSVTMPHKAMIIDSCDDLTDTARALGAVNCVFRDGDQIIGDNTDGSGFVAGVEHDFSVSIDAMNVVVVGAGGAARAAARALTQAGAGDVAIINRSADRAAKAIAAAGGAARIGHRSDLGSADLVVNATPLGMGDTAYSSSVPFDPSVLPDHAIVADLIYHPLETPLLAEARVRGLRAQNGVSMLVFQAAAQFERWTGRDAPVETMIGAARAVIG